MSNFAKKSIKHDESAIMRKSIKHDEINIIFNMEEIKNTRRKTSRVKSEDDQLAALGRVQPQAVELERAVLGACIIEQDAFGTVSDFLKPRSFYEKKHQVIFEAIQSLVSADAPVDVLTVVDLIYGRQSGKLGLAGAVQAAGGA